MLRVLRQDDRAARLHRDELPVPLHVRGRAPAAAATWAACRRCSASRSTSTCSSKAERTRQGFGGVKAAREPLPMCPFSVERSYEGTGAAFDCVNPRFFDATEARPGRLPRVRPARRGSSTRPLPAAASRIVDLMPCRARGRPGPVPRAAPAVPGSAARRGTRGCPSSPSSPSPRLAWRSTFDPSAVLRVVQVQARSRSRSDLAVALVDRRRSSPPGCGSRSPRRAGGTSRGRRRAARRRPTRRSARRAPRSVRPIVHPAPAVFSNSSGQRSVAASAFSNASADHLERRRGASAPLPLPGMHDHAAGADPVADRERMGQRGRATCAAPRRRRWRR